MDDREAPGWDGTPILANAQRKYPVELPQDVEEIPEIQ